MEVEALPPQSDPTLYLNLLESQLVEQVDPLNAQAPGKIQPSLDVLDNLSASIIVTR